jgi:hypothetical protein
MSIKITLDFDKRTMSKGTIDILSNGLRDDPEKDVILLSLKECLNKLAKGNKLPYKAANYLLVNILNAITLEGSDASEEIRADSQVDPDDRTRDESDDTTQNPRGQVEGSTEGASSSHTYMAKDRNDGESKPDKSNKSDKKTKTLCRFFARGHCTRKQECRFDHPKICNTFRQHGSTSNSSQGCNGKCEAFHPNACRNSIKDKTCSWKDCRFFHLKGTKRTIVAQDNSAKQNWRPNNQDRSGPNFESKNKFASLNTGGQNPKKRTTPIQGANSTPERDLVTSKEKTQLSLTLEAIMNRISAMESRLTSYPQQAHHPQQHQQLQHTVQPLLSPAVPQPSTQTQYQWASQPQWTQSQTQPQY